MSDRTEKLSAATVKAKLEAAVKHHGSIHHHARRIAAQHFAAPTAPPTPPK
jgi:hypothetical protein